MRASDGTSQTHNMPPVPQNVSVTVPVDQAIGRVKLMLFQPFNLARWFVIGFCAWLALLGKGGFHGGTGYNFGSHHGPGGAGNLRQAIEQARDFVIQNLAWMLPVALAMVVLGVALWIVILWLSSRGRFMFLHCVAHNRAEVRLPWHRYANEGNSLFWFRLMLGIAGFITMSPGVAGIILLVVQMVNAGAPSFGGVAGVGGLALALMLLILLWQVVAKFTEDFVVPIQFIQGGTTRQGWLALVGLLSANTGIFILYLLFQIILSLAVFVLILTLVVATCCVAGCLFALPYLGTVLLLPVFLFQRAYSAYYLAQFGSGFDVFAAPAAPVPPAN